MLGAKGRACSAPVGSPTLVLAESGLLGVLTPKSCLSQRSPLSRARLEEDGKGWTFRSDHSHRAKGRHQGPTSLCSVTRTHWVEVQQGPLGEGQGSRDTACHFHTQSQGHPHSSVLLKAQTGLEEKELRPPARSLIGVGSTVRLGAQRLAHLPLGSYSSRALLLLLA